MSFVEEFDTHVVESVLPTGGSTSAKQDELLLTLINFIATNPATAALQQAIVDAIQANPTSLLNTEATQQLVLTAIQNLASAGLSTEATQLLVKAALDTLNLKDFATGTKQDSIVSAIGNIDFSALSTEATLLLVKSALDTLNIKDFATATKQDTGNTSLATIAGKDFGTEATLLLVKAALDTLNSKSLATASNQSTANGYLSLIKTAVETIDNAILGNEMQVDVLAMPAVSIDSIVEGTVIPLPVGAATGVKQDTIITKLGALVDNTITGLFKSVGDIGLGDNLITRIANILTKLTSLESKDFSTSTKQDTINTSIGTINTKVGEVSATPTANTLLGRLKDIVTSITGLLTGIVLSAGTNIIGKVSIDQTTDGVTNKVKAYQGAAWSIGINTSVLPTGAATSAKQDAMITAISSISSGGGVNGFGTGSFFRPNSGTYSVGDAISSSTTLNPGALAIEFDFATLGMYVEITDIEIFIDGAADTVPPMVNIYIFEVAPTKTNNDNAALSFSGDSANYVKPIAINEYYTAMGASGNSKLLTWNGKIKRKIADGTNALYVLLQAANAYQPPAATSAWVINMRGVGTVE